MHIYVPSSDTIEEYWEKSQDNPNKAYHFVSYLEILIDYIDDHPDLVHEEIPKTIDPISHIHPFVAAVEALYQWQIGEGRYKHAKAAKHLLSESVQRGLDEKHHSIFEQSLIELVELQTQLQHDNTPELTIVVDYLYENHYEQEDDENGGRFHGLIDLVLDHADPDDQQERQLLNKIFVICIIRGNRCANTDAEKASGRISDIDSGINAFEKAIQIAEKLNIDEAGLRPRYVDEYRRYFEQQGKRYDILKGKLINEGLQEQLITETLKDDEKVAWQQEMQDAFTRGNNRLKHSGKSMPIVPTDVIESQADSIKDIFKLIAFHHDPTTALFWLINEPELLPPFETGGDQTFSLIDQVSRIHPQPSGHVTSLDSDSSITREYARNMLRTRVLVGGTIYELIEEGWITERNFFELLNMIPGVSDHNIWYLTDAVNYLFSREYTAAIHICIPRLETTLYEVLNHLENNVVRQMERGTGTRTLSPLLDEFESYVADDFHEYIELAYAKKEGEAVDGNLRNRVAHGHLRIGQNEPSNGILPLVDILRICYRVIPTPYVAQFGYPSRVAYLADVLQRSGS